MRSKSTKRIQAEGKFVVAGLYRLTGCDLDYLDRDNPTDDLLEARKQVLHSLRSAARKMSLKDLDVLYSAFDGFTRDGKSLG